MSWLANILYFGCRSSSKDQHYWLEWQKYSLRQQVHYRVAFSRDRPEGEKKVYVQDLIEEDAAQIWNIVGVQKGWVFISGCALSARKGSLSLTSLICWL